MLRVQAGAKINWTLDILGTRPDGYHEMDMLMSSVALSDTLWMETAERLSLHVEGEAHAVAAEEKNLVMKAARALQAATDCQLGASVKLAKCIPVGAGMGGGSADAAAALLGLNQLWGLGLSVQQLHAIGRTVGADVPFLLTGGLARVRGIGEVIRPLPSPAPLWLVVTQPCAGLSTPEIFRAFDGMQAQPMMRPNTEAAQEALLCRDLQKLAWAMGNVMEPVSVAKRPEIQQAIQKLESLGALRAMMTGSGSAVYGVFETEQRAATAFGPLKKQWERTFLTHTQAESVRIKSC